MHVFKFTVPADKFYVDPVDPDVSYRGYLAVTIAEDEAAARARLEEYANENGLCSTWLRVARVVKLPVMDRAVLGWAEV